MEDLPRLNPTVRMTDPAKWTTVVDGTSEIKKGIVPVPHDADTPSEEAYLGTFLSY